MERKYKKYLFADVPIPRASAYRQRKKQRLDEEIVQQEEVSIVLYCMIESIIIYNLVFLYRHRYIFYTEILLSKIK